MNYTISALQNATQPLIDQLSQIPQNTTIGEIIDQIESQVGW